MGRRGSRDNGGAAAAEMGHYSMHGMPSTNADTASILSDADGDFYDEGVDENGDPLLRGAPYSEKAALLASEIASMEQLVGRLEERNKWLTWRLIQNQKKSIASMFHKSDAAIKHRMFEAWREGLHLLRIENQLEKQTAALDQCQGVAQELGAALAQEQTARKRVEEANRAMRDELEHMIAFNEGLQQQGQDGLKRENLLGRQLKEAEKRIHSCREEAISIIENVNLWEERKNSDLTQKTKPSSTEEKVEEDFIVQSERVRQEARETMQKVSSVLVPLSHGTPTPSPERPGRHAGANATIPRHDRDSPASRSPFKMAAKSSASEFRPTAGSAYGGSSPAGFSGSFPPGAGYSGSVPPGAGYSGSFPSEGAGYAASASGSLITSPIVGSRLGAWQYESAMLPVSGGLDASQTMPAGTMMSPPKGTRQSAAGSLALPSGGSQQQGLRNSRGELLEPWWNVRRVNANGQVTVIPQQIAQQ